MRLAVHVRADDEAVLHICCVLDLCVIELEAECRDEGLVFVSEKVGKAVSSGFGRRGCRSLDHRSLHERKEREEHRLSGVVSADQRLDSV